MTCNDLQLCVHRSTEAVPADKKLPCPKSPAGKILVNELFMRGVVVFAVITFTCTTRKICLPTAMLSE